MSATILLIDDDQDMGQMMHDALTPGGYKTLYAQDGLTGLDILQDQPVDLVLLDLMLPEIDGWEICRRIREFSDVPIIIISALGREQDVIRGLELGADDYITKPFRMGEIKARMRANLRRCQRPFAVGRRPVDPLSHRRPADGKAVGHRVQAPELLPGQSRAHPHPTKPAEPGVGLGIHGPNRLPEGLRASPAPQD